MECKINEIKTVELNGYNETYYFPEMWLQKMAKDFYEVNLNEFLNSYTCDDAELLFHAFMDH